MRLIDLDDSAHNHMCFNDEHEIWCIDTNKTVDAVPVDMLKGRINDLKKMLMDIGEDELDAIWDLRTRIETLTELLEMWAERRNDETY